MTLGKGAVLIDSEGNVAVIERRKEDDTGWWCVGGGGLADWVIDKRWRPLDRLAARRAWEVTEEVAQLLRGGT